MERSNQRPIGRRSSAPINPILPCVHLSSRAVWPHGAQAQLLIRLWERYCQGGGNVRKPPSECRLRGLAGWTGRRPPAQRCLQLVAARQKSDPGFVPLRTDILLAVFLDGCSLDGSICFVCDERSLPRWTGHFRRMGPVTDIHDHDRYHGGESDLGVVRGLPPREDPLCPPQPTAVPSQCAPPP